MPPNPLTGVLYHGLGGFASASFHVPYRGVRRWSWEIYWLTGGIFSWILAPWFFASVQTNDLLGVLSATPSPTLLWPIFFGVLWGFALKEWKGAADPCHHRHRHGNMIGRRSSLTTEFQSLRALARRSNFGHSFRRLGMALSVSEVPWAIRSAVPIGIEYRESLHYRHSVPHG